MKQHAYELGDRVWVYRDETKTAKVDQDTFKIVGIRMSEVECEGDWSGGTHKVCQTSWVSIDMVEKWKPEKIENKVIDDGKCHSETGRCQNSNVCQGLDYCMYLGRLKD